MLTAEGKRAVRSVRGDDLPNPVTSHLCGPFRLPEDRAPAPPAVDVLLAVAVAQSGIEYLGLVADTHTIPPLVDGVTTVDARDNKTECAMAARHSKGNSGARIVIGGLVGGVSIDIGVDGRSGDARLRRVIVRVRLNVSLSWNRDRADEKVRIAPRAATALQTPIRFTLLIVCLHKMCRNSVGSRRMQAGQAKPAGLRRIEVDQDSGPRLGRIGG